MAKIYVAETPILKMGRILKNKLSPLWVKKYNYSLNFVICMVSNSYILKRQYKRAKSRRKRMRK